MSITFEFEARVRTQCGKAEARRMRREQDLIPAVVYGADKAPQSISMLHKDIFHALANGAVFSHILKLKVGDNIERVVIKDVQRHAYKPKILHVDFLRVKMKEKITMNVPFHFEGEETAPGIKEGGQLTKSMTDIEIRCLPADLPEFVTIDVSNMALDETKHLSDLQLPSGVELVQATLNKEHDHPIVSCHLPKVKQEDIEAEQQETGLAEESAAQAKAETEASHNNQPQEHAENKEDKK